MVFTLKKITPKLRQPITPETLTDIYCGKCDEKSHIADIGIPYCGKYSDNSEENRFLVELFSDMCGRVKRCPKCLEIHGIKK